MPAKIYYEIDFSRKNQHIFQLTLEVKNNHTNRLTLSLPAWIPGSYMIRDFAKHIIQIEAKTDSGNMLQLEAIDKQSWQLETSGNDFTVKYQVYAFDTSVRTAYLDNQRAFFNGSSVFICVNEYAECQHNLKIRKDGAANNWQVATGLRRSASTNKYQFGEYWAANYADLIDCPVEISDFSSAEFDVNGVTHHLILSGKHYADVPRITKDLNKICQHHIELFGEAPFDEYWFLTNILPNGFGGLEHKNSTALLCSHFDFANPQQPNELSDGYVTFLGLCAHEYFHAWNVCRIKPQELMPYQLNKEQYTTQLWAFEGITSYYDDFSLFRSGIIDFDKYLSLLSKTYSRVNRGAGQAKQSLADSSFYAWTKFYQQGADAANNIVSYYTKGSLIALWMDLHIRKYSNYKSSLDDLMRELWDLYKNEKGTTESVFLELFESLTDQAHAMQLEQLLHQADIIDLAELLTDFGIKIEKKAPAISDLFKSIDEAVYFGTTIKQHSTGVLITSVLQDSPAEKSGIAANDILIAVDGLKVTAENFQTVLQHQPLDSETTIHFFRNNQLIETKTILTEAPKHLIELNVEKSELVLNWQKVLR